MPALTLPPAFAALAAFSRFVPAQPVHTFLRTTGYKLRPPRPVPHAPRITRAQDAVLASGAATPRQRNAVLCERRLGAVPTIVLGGFVPDATEQVFLLRGLMLRQGSVYYFHYPRGGFSLELLCAQLDDLVEELNTIHGQPPAIFAVSFGAGAAMEWLRRARLAGRRPEIAGLVLVSPVGCAEDIVTPGELKPTTLLGRALKPYVDAGKLADAAVVEKSRAIFAKMFEAGAQNREGLRTLMTAGELKNLRDAVLAAIQRIEVTGACERVQSMQLMPPLAAAPFQGGIGSGVGASPSAGGRTEVFTHAPTCIFYAEKENAVLAERSPTRAAFAARLHDFFPRGRMEVIRAATGAPVQHASLIFHYFQFLPPIAAFYRGVKSRKLPLAA